MTNTLHHPVPAGGKLPWFRAAVRIALRCVVGAILLLVLLLVLLQFPPFARWGARTALALANPWNGTSTSLENVSGTWLTSLELDHLRISDDRGTALLSLDTLRVSYDLTALLQGVVRIDECILRRPVVTSGLAADGSWTLTAPFGGGAAQPDTTSSLSISVGSLSLTGGEFRLLPERQGGTGTLGIRSIALEAHGILIAEGFAATVDSVHAVYGTGQPGAVEATLDAAGSISDTVLVADRLSLHSPRSSVSGRGRVSFPLMPGGSLPEVDLSLTAEPVSYEDIHPFFAFIGPEGQANVSVSIHGNRRQMHGSAHLQLTGGGTADFQMEAQKRLDGRLVLNVEGNTSGLSPAGLTGASDSAGSVNATLVLRGEGSTLDDFAGTASLLLKDSRIAGFGPLNTRVQATMERGTVQARIQGSLRKARFTLDATVEPLLAAPRYQVTGALSFPDTDAPGHHELFPLLAGMQCTVSASGEGFRPDSSRAEVRIDAAWEKNPSLSALTLDAGLQEGRARAAVLLTTPGGSARLNASATFGDEPEYRIDSLAVRNLDIAAILGDNTPVVLNGSVRASGRGTDLHSLTAEAAVHLNTSRIANMEISRAEMLVTIVAGTLQSDVTTSTSGGEFRVRAGADPFSKTPSFSLQSVAFRDLDLGKVIGTDNLSTDLSGTLNAHVRFGSSGELDQFLEGRGMAGQTSGEIAVSIEPSRINKQEVTGTCRAVLRQGSVGVDAELSTSGGGVTIHGSARPFGRDAVFDVSRIDFRHVDIGRLGGWEKLSTDLTGTASGEMRGGSTESMRLRFALDIGASRVNQEPLTAGSIRGVLERDSIDLNAELRFERGGVHLEGHGSRAEDAVTGRLRTTLHFDDLRRLLPSDSIDVASAAMDLAADGTWGLPEKTRISGSWSGHGRLDSLSVDTLLCAFAVVGRTLDIDTLHLSSNVAALSAHGAIAMLDSGSAPGSSFELAGTVTSLKPLERLAGFRSGRFNGAEASLSLAGPPDSTRVHLTLKSRAAEFNDIYVSNPRFSAEATLGSGFRLLGAEADAGLDALYAGASGLQQSTLHLDSDGHRHGFHVFVMMEQGSSTRLAGTARQDSGMLTIELDTLTLNGRAAQWDLEHPATVTIGRGVQVQAFDLRSAKGRFFIDGTIASAGEQNFTCNADSLDVGEVARVLGRPDLGGTISAEVRVTGPASRARAAGNLQAHLTSGDEPLGTVEAGIDWVDSLLTIDGEVAQPDGSRLSAAAKLHRTLVLQGDSTTASPGRGAADFSIDAERFNLGFIRPFLNPQLVDEMSGLLSMDVRGRVSGDGLRVQGSLGLDSARVSLPALGATYDNIGLASTLDEDHIRIQEARVSSGNGSLTTSGTIGFRSLDTLRTDLTCSLDNFLVLQTPVAKATLSGDLSVRGTPAELVVGGSLRVRDSYVTIPDLGNARTIERVELTEEDYVMLERWFGYRPRIVAQDSTPPVTGLTLDLDLAIERNTWIRKRQDPTLALELEGEVSVHSQPFKPLQITGTLRPLKGRSYVGQFGRQFDITDGEILFNGPLEETELRVGSEYKVPSKGGAGVSEVVLYMSVESKQGLFTFHLTSDPAMDESEILSYLATGRLTGGGMAKTDDQGNIGGAAALEQLVGAAGGLTEGKIPLDVFQIRQDGARGITIVGGNYITPKTYLGIRQPILINQEMQDRYTTVLTQFEVEYEATRWLYLNFQGGSSRVLFLLKSRYAY